MDPVRRSFDAIAPIYAREFAGELARKPFDRALLDAFARDASTPVLDLGCGPAHVGAYVAARGPGAVGLDHSVVSLAQARALHPALGVVAADLHALPFATASAGGIVAFYSLIYGTDEDLLRALRGCARVLRPGAPLLMAVHGGEGEERFETFHDIPIEVTMRYRPPERVAAIAAEAGVEVLETRARDPYPFEHPTQRVYLRARLPARARAHG